LAGRVNTAAPGHRRHPPRPNLIHAERGNPVEVRAGLGRPTVRDAEVLGGNRMPKKRMPAAERQRETTAKGWTFTSAVHNRPDTGGCPNPKGC
jgi:hypothetical protein